MSTVPEAYYQFIMDYSPYAYVIPPSMPDTQFGKTGFAAAFAIDFLFEAYSKPQFEDRRTEIRNKITSLAEWVLSQQCLDDDKLSYGGFKSTETSTYYYSVDACRIIPSLLKAYTLTNVAEYLNAAKLAGTMFLYNMQHKPSELGVHDKYYGGFARAVTSSDTWLHEIDVECLYGLTGLKMLCTVDPANSDTYNTMMTEAIGFLRQGLEGFYLYYDPRPNGDAEWHRLETDNRIVHDDSIAYALAGLYDFESWSNTVQKVYEFMNNADASPLCLAYNPVICWSGYIDVISRCPACDYYDSVSSGILWKIRKNHDKPSYSLSKRVIDVHQEEFMFWGAKHTDYSHVENKKATATVSWLSLLYLNYEEPLTRFTQILQSNGETVALYPLCEKEETVTYGQPMEIRALISAARSEELLIEAGYAPNDYLTLYTFLPIRVHDKIRWRGTDYEAQSIQRHDFRGQPAHFKTTLRRFIGQ